SASSTSTTAASSTTVPTTTSTTVTTSTTGPLPTTTTAPVPTTTTSSTTSSTLPETTTTLPETTTTLPETTTTTSTSTTTSTQQPPPTVLDFVLSSATGPCGNTMDASSTVIKTLTCGGLSIGAGASLIPEGPTPDGSQSRFSLSCAGSSCTIGPTSAAP